MIDRTRWHGTIQASDLTIDSNRENSPAIERLLAMKLPLAIAWLERSLIERALWNSQGNRSRAADLLGIHWQLLYSKMKEYHLNVDETRQRDGNAGPDDVADGKERQPDST